MKAKSYLILITKACAALLCAFVILNTITYFYYFIPYNLETKTGATDYVLPPGFTGFNGVEGYVPIRIDENGYNNTSIPDKIDILCMGSSHTLAYNVRPGTGYPALLGQKTAKIYNMYTYNIGMFGHEWYYCMDNLSDALKTFHPSDYVIVESFYCTFETDKLKKLNAGNYPDAGQVVSRKSRFLKQFPYLQLAGHQLKNMLLTPETTDITPDNLTKDKNALTKDNKKELQITLKNAKKTVSDAGCKLIFLYLPTIRINENGEAYTVCDTDSLTYLKNLCKQYDFLFVDMTESFLNTYKKDYLLPYGFANTQIGYGHLNRYGHQQIAQALYNAINDDIHSR